jgi:hypothetical protein
MRLWPRNAVSSDRPSPLADQQAALRACEDRLRALEARVTDMAATTGLLRIEWAEVLDKINRWASRQTGRLARAANAALEKAAEDAPGSTNDDGPVPQHPPTSKSDLRRLVRGRGPYSNQG